ncbi:MULTISPECIES: transketolase [unclassified Bradyrhizobium]|uniref:transketolase n=1 Tax=unclassified Bradyrhizobium TaxID=2631580 RepID=UPI0028F14E5D|nr:MULTISPECIES: transketolase [unclassified Bradyrhizobium]
MRYTLDTEALAIRIRKHVVRMAAESGSAHVGSALSIADILAVLYGKELHFDPEDPILPTRDRVILSKGHAGTCMYAVLAESGFFPVALLKEHFKNGSVFSGHVSHKGVPGVELSTGSLGHGLGVGTGMAMELRRQGGVQRVFVILSDGECDEGSNWEAILFSGHHKLSNLTAIIDYNKLQGLTTVAKTLGLEPFTDKWRSFGWRVTEVDGHNHAELSDAVASSGFTPEPLVIIAHTTKGKGVSFMENMVEWHYRSPKPEELAIAMRELEFAAGV